MALPNTYKQVEYIESSGTQYIDTGYIPSNNTKIECEIGSWDTSIGRYETMYGTRYQYSTSNSRGFYLDYDNNTGGHNYGFGKDYGSTSLFTFQDGGIHTIEQSSNGLYQDGILKKTFDAMTFTSPVNMCIYALNDNGTIKEYGGFKLYYFKIWNSGTLVRDFIPCYRIVDGVAGLYDLVNNIFYTNQGTGKFEYPAQSGKITHIYLGTNLIRPPASPEITEVYNLNSTTEVKIGKSGYKIKQIMYEKSYNFSSTGNWYIAGIHTYVKGDNTKPSIYCDNYTGGTYGYDYGYGLGKYGGVVVRAQNSTESSQVSIVKINAGVTTSSKGADKIIFTKDSVEYHYGQTAGSWTQEGTVALNSTISGYVSTLFSNGEVYVNESTWGGPTFTGKVTVTYESV